MARQKAKATSEWWDDNLGSDIMGKEKSKEKKHSEWDDAPAKGGKNVSKQHSEWGSTYSSGGKVSLWDEPPSDTKKSKKESEWDDPPSSSGGKKVKQHSEWDDAPATGGKQKQHSEWDADPTKKDKSKSKTKSKTQSTRRSDWKDVVDNAPPVASKNSDNHPQSSSSSKSRSKGSSKSSSGTTGSSSTSSTSSNRKQNKSNKSKDNGNSVSRGKPQSSPSQKEPSRPERLAAPTGPAVGGARGKAHQKAKAATKPEPQTTARRSFFGSRRSQVDSAKNLGGASNDSHSAGAFGSFFDFFGWNTSSSKKKSKNKKSSRPQDTRISLGLGLGEYDPLGAITETRTTEAPGQGKNNDAKKKTYRTSEEAHEEKMESISAARLQKVEKAQKERRENRRASTGKPKDTRISLGLGLGDYDPLGALTETPKETKKGNDFWGTRI